MNKGFLRTSSGHGSYAQIVTICLLALGMGVAAFLYFSNQRNGKSTTGSTEFVPPQADIERKLLRDLAKSRNRSLSDEQVTALKNALSPLKGERVAIECGMEDLKSCYLALELNLIFEASGWIVEEFLFAARATPGEAVILRAKDASVMPRAEDMSRLLVSVGLSVTTRVDSEQLFDLKIVVPAKNAKPA